jgi:hypothetical protein
LISKGSSLYWQRPSTVIWLGATSMSPVGSLGFLLVRSRTRPVTAMVVSLFRAFTCSIISSVSMTTWVVP